MAVSAGQQRGGTLSGLLLLVLFVLLAEDVSAEGPSCYICTWSANHEKCGDANFTVQPEERAHYMINCRSCYKKVLYNAEGEKSQILRGCVLDSANYILGCQKVHYQDGGYMEICGCDSDYCNSARSPDTSPIWLLLVATIAVMVFCPQFINGR